MEFEKEVRLKDGTQVLLRPIRHEDILPMLHLVETSGFRIEKTRFEHDIIKVVFDLWEVF